MSKNNENGKDFLGFRWSGKDKAINDAESFTDKHLVAKKNKSFEWNNTKNIFIEGDNLDALKLLKREFENKIRVIYIDPPYNTGKDFVYKDKLKHSDWCSMIYSRLKLAKELLSEDGVIFISIDDNEICNLKNICEEIFGSDNFVTQFIYEKTQHFGRQKLNTYSNAEYVLCYAKNLYNKTGKFKELLVERVNTVFRDAPLFNASNRVCSLVFPPCSVKFNIDDGVYSKTTSPAYELKSPVTVKNGVNQNELVLKFKSRWSQKKLNDELKKGTTFWVKTKAFAIRAVYGENKVSNTAPKQIIFTNKNNKFCTYNRFGEQVKTSETATSDLQKLLGNSYFDYPKPVSLISYLISLIYDYKAQNFADDFYVLDFFAGSGTTAQAVMELNTKDNGKRKFILIQKPVVFDYGSEAYRAGFKDICALSEERIKRVITNIKTSKHSNIADKGFRVYEVK